MIITQIKDLTTKKSLVTIDDYYSFPLYRSEIKKLKLAEDSQMEEESLDDIKREILYPTALNRALYLIKAKEYTKKEISGKLSQGHYPEDIIEAVLSELTEKGFINDKRYAQGYIAYHTCDKSRQAITGALIMKGIDKETIDETFDMFLEENPDFEEKLCLELLEKKYYGAKADADFEIQNKAKAYLARKGFSYDTADRAVKKFFDI